MEPEDAKEPSSESYSRVVNEYMKEEEKKGEESLHQSKVEVSSSVSSIDLKDLLGESFYNKRKKYLPLEQLHKKTKNRVKSGKAKIERQSKKNNSEAEDPSQLQISSIDSIELNKMLNDSQYRNRGRKTPLPDALKKT